MVCLPVPPLPHRDQLQLRRRDIIAKRRLYPPVPLGVCYDNHRVMSQKDESPSGAVEREKVRARGYSVDEQNNRGAVCVGAPVFDQDGRIEAALGLSGTTNKVNSQIMPRILDALKDAAGHTSKQSGYRAPHRESVETSPCNGTSHVPL
jgi:hypothetical protein